MKIPNHNLADDVAYVMISAEQLHQRIVALAKQIDAEYADKDDLILICVLRGAFIFLGDLSRQINRPHEVDFMVVSSYGRSNKSSGSVRIEQDLMHDIVNRHVLIVEDIIDSGNTLTKLTELLSARRPASLRIVTMLDKPARREKNVKVDYVGFEIGDEFVVGYGLDFAEEYRNLPYIAVLKPEIFAHLEED